MNELRTTDEIERDFISVIADRATVVEPVHRYAHHVARRRAWEAKRDAARKSECGYLGREAIDEIERQCVVKVPGTFSTPDYYVTAAGEYHVFDRAQIVAYDYRQSGGKRLEEYAAIAARMRARRELGAAIAANASRPQGTPNRDAFERYKRLERIRNHREFAIKSLATGAGSFCHENAPPLNEALCAWAERQGGRTIVLADADVSVYGFPQRAAVVSAMKTGVDIYGAEFRRGDLCLSLYGRNRGVKGARTGAKMVVASNVARAERDGLSGAVDVFAALREAKEQKALEASAGRRQARKEKFESRGVPYEVTETGDVRALADIKVERWGLQIVWDAKSTGIVAKARKDHECAVMGLGYIKKDAPYVSLCVIFDGTGRNHQIVRLSFAGLMAATLGDAVPNLEAARRAASEEKAIYDAKIESERQRKSEAMSKKRNRSMNTRGKKWSSSGRKRVLL